MSEWWRSAVIYQIYPRSFQDDGGTGVGNLAGVTRRLDHVAGLGVDGIWLSPFFTSPMDDMGYDISDHRGVDPVFGTLEDFTALLARAHELGLKVIIDQVPSHTSAEHPWFAESRLSRDGPKSDWYVWAEANRDGTPPNNWLSVFGGPAWTWDSRRRQYYMHSFLASQPQMNFHQPQVQDAVLDAMRFWLELGVDGFRLDSINYPFHDAQLRDNPPEPEATEDDWANPYNVQKHVYDKTRPETLGFLERVRALMDEYDGRATVGEVGEGRGAARIMGQYTSGQRLNMAYSFEMLGNDFSARHFRRCIEGFFSEAPEGWPCWAFSNHDVVRHVSRWAVHDAGRDALARLTIALLCSFEGALCIYQGEELGQTETSLAYHEIVDPPGLKLWPDYKGRDGCRTPMVWEEGAPHGGFSSAQPWLPVKPEQAARAVSRMEAETGSILHHYRAVIAHRKASPALREGRTRFLDLPEGLMGFVRDLPGGGGVTCLFNLTPKPQQITLAGSGHIAGPVQGAHLDGALLSLGPNGYAWLEGAGANPPPEPA